MENLLGLTQRQTWAIHGLATLLTGADFSWDNFLLRAAQTIADANIDDALVKAAVHALLSEWGLMGLTTEMPRHYDQIVTGPSMVEASLTGKTTSNLYVGRNIVRKMSRPYKIRAPTPAAIPIQMAGHGRAPRLPA